MDEKALVLVAVSGGADSLALLHALHAANVPLVCATFNHRLRPEAGDEVEHVRNIAEGLGAQFVTDSADTAAYAATERLSVEDAARTLRYRFLFRAARAAGAQAVAVGHTADDQAETVLMHFLRGAGLSGLKGMPYRVVLPVFDAEIPLVRPLLDWWRADTEEYCRQNGLSPIYDPSNTDTTYFRNRLRHELIPQLESYNPRVRQALVHTALALQGDDALLADVSRAAWQKSVLEQGTDYIAFERTALENLPLALRRNLFRRAAFELRPGLRDVDFDALERAASLKQVDLAGGLSVFTEGQKVFLATRDADLPSAQWPQATGRFSVGGGQYLLENNWALVCEQPSLKTEDLDLRTDPWSAWLDADLVGSGLMVRTMQVGDRFKPLGMEGKSVKLQDFFVNRKVPKRARERWPLVCVGDEIAWVVGLRLAHPFRVTGLTKRVLRLQLQSAE